MWAYIEYRGDFGYNANKEICAKVAFKIISGDAKPASARL
jgi:hypothetical protein